MATPIIRQVSWSAALPQFAAVFAAFGIAYALGASDPLIWAAVLFFAYSICSRQLITKAHREGIRLVKQQRFAEAIPKFQESFDFIERHPWIDRYRSVLLMSPSAASYREMALANIAFCYSQIGNGQESRAYYQKCLDRFPESGLAAAGLRMLDSVAPPASVAP